MIWQGRQSSVRKWSPVIIIKCHIATNTGVTFGHKLAMIATESTTIKAPFVVHVLIDRQLYGGSTV